MTIPNTKSCSLQHSVVGTAASQIRQIYPAAWVLRFSLYVGFIWHLW